MNSFMKFISLLIYYLRVLIDLIIDFVFSLIYFKCAKYKISRPTDEILTYNITTLSKKILNREVTCESVINAYLNRLDVVDRVCNAVVDKRCLESLKEARNFDLLIATNDPSIKNKPLLGIPFTTKDSTAVCGMLHTFGLRARKNIRADRDADVIKKLKDAGAILIAVTNVPEINLWQETRNMLFGQTLNPYDTTKTVGGSSGGEACLVTTCATAFGIGSDIGGSIRSPAFFCGVYGHKPTTGSVPMRGFTLRSGDNDFNTMVTAGPICKSATDLSPILKIILNSKEIIQNLNTPVNVSELKCYYITEINHPLISPISDVMKTSFNKTLNFFSDLCKTAPIKLDIPEIKYTYKLWRFWMSKESPSFSEVFKHETGEICLITEVIKKFFGQSDYTLAAIIKLIDDKLPLPDEKWAIEITEKLSNTFMKYLDDNNSILIFPSYTWPASYHYTAFFRPYNFVYWALFNVLKFPVTQVPIGLTSNNLPMGIQIVAAPGNDHLCIAAALEMEKNITTYVPPFPVPDKD